MKNDFSVMELLKKTFQQISEGILILDTSKSNYPIIYANKAIQIITGFEPHHLLQKDISTIDLSNSKQTNKEKLFNSIQNMKKSTIDIIIKNNDKNVFTRITVNPIFDESKNISNLALVIRDITEARIKLLNCVRIDVVKTTLESVNDIIFNYMNHLELFRMECEETTNVSKSKLTDFDATFNDTLEKLKKLNSIMDFKEIKITDEISVLSGV